MVKVFIFCILSFGLNAQQEDYIRPGLIASGLTISPTLMLNRDEGNVYLSGFLEGYLDKHISLRGETHYFMNSFNDSAYFDFSSRTTFGLQFHMNNNNLDAHLGFMPGLSVMKLSNDLTLDGSQKTHVVPTVAITVGGSFFVWKYVHFFANITYLYSNIRKVNTESGRADEIMISAGLGFNLNTLKIKSN